MNVTTSEQDKSRKKNSRLRVALFISAQIFAICFGIQELLAQEITDAEILELERQLREIEMRLVPIDEELRLSNERFIYITGEIEILKQELEEPANLFRKITRIFKERSLRNKLAESRDLAVKIDTASKARKPLVREFITVADKLIERSSLRMTALMKTMKEAISKDDVPARDRASKQYSALWRLTEKTTSARNRYAGSLSGEELMKPFLPLLSSDPVELRLGSASLRDAAISARAKAMERKRQMKELQSKKRLLEGRLEIWEENQRRNEERESMGAESGTASIPWGFNEPATRREIEEINQKISALSSEVQRLESDAESFENQSKVLEQRASQIEAELKGKP